ncbi:MAG: hypothetical protein GX811_02735, partial [Lentisphaerae bacterium]|nr:hypothetical protein [Lentisphaerota bacterium]
DHTRFKDLPFDDGDISYFLFFEAGIEYAEWQLGLDYAPNVNGFFGHTVDEEASDKIEVNYVLTPQLNLIFKDRMFRGGVGVLTSYIRQKDGEDEWLSLYWQLQLGIELPIFKRISAGVTAYYLLDKWGDISDFKFDELEYAARIKYVF